MRTKPKKKPEKRLKTIANLRSSNIKSLLESFFNHFKAKHPVTDQNSDQLLELFVREFARSLGESSDEFFNYMMLLIETTPGLREELLKKLGITGWQTKQ